MKNWLTYIYGFVKDVCGIFRGEMVSVAKDEGMIVFVFLLPLFYPLLYSWIYNNEVVRDVPVAVVDSSHSSTSRQLIRRCDASPDVKVAFVCSDMEEARRLVGLQQCYGIVYIPGDFATRLERMQQSVVSVYCNMGIMLAYKAIYQTVMAVTAEMNAEIQVELSGNFTGREDEITTSPIEIIDVPIFNNTGGYGNFIIPAVLALIIQQVLLLAAGMSAGTSFERNRNAQFMPVFAKRMGLMRIVGGTAFFYFLVSAVMSAYVMLAVPRMFGFVHLVHAVDFAMFALPYALSSIFFALTVASFIRRREDVMLFVVFTSVPFLFMSGVSWPESNISWFWKTVSCLFPSTFGIQGFVKMNTMGALLSDIGPECKALWVQSGIYFVTACLAKRHVLDLCARRHEK